MSSTLTNLTAATTWSGTDLFYALVGGNSRKIAAAKFLVAETSSSLAMQDSTTAQTFRVYKTFTDSSNYERLALTSVSNEFQIAVESAGTGSDNIYLRFVALGNGFIHMNAMRVTDGATDGVAGLGYEGGAGASVTQGTSKSTAVTNDRMCGRITMHNESLAAGAEVTFRCWCTPMRSTDVVIINHQGGGTVGAYQVTISEVSDASFQITAANVSTGSLGEAIVLNYAIIKSVIS